MRPRRAALLWIVSASLSSGMASLWIGMASLSIGTAAKAGPSDPPPEAVLATLPFLQSPIPNAVLIDLAPEEASRGMPLQLDTGAQSTVLTPGLARELGINVRSLKNTPYRRRTRLGRDLLFQVDTRGGDQSARLSPFEFGLLGGNFLSDYVVEIDYAGRRVRFLDPEVWQVPERSQDPEEVVLPFKLIAGRPVVEIDVDGVPMSLLLDTGSPIGLIVGGRMTQKLSGQPRELHGFRLFGVRGEVRAQLAEVKRLAIGDITLESQPAIVAPRGLYQQGTNSDSVLGHDILARFTVRIDYPRRRLWLRRAGPGETRFMGLAWQGARASGALVEPHREQFWIRYVVGGSPAEHIGLAPQDMVEAVDGIPVDDPADVHDGVGRGSRFSVRRQVEDESWRKVVLAPPLADEPAPGAPDS